MRILLKDVFKKSQIELSNREYFNVNPQIMGVFFKRPFVYKLRNFLLGERIEHHITQPSKECIDYIKKEFKPTTT